MELNDVVAVIRNRVMDLVAELASKRPDRLQRMGAHADELHNMVERLKFELWRRQQGG